jgi:hypothetical protein
LIFTKALEERDKEALEEKNNLQHVHEQKKTEKSKRLRTIVACQPATAGRDGENRGRDEEREREATPSNANLKQPNLRNENPNRCSCGYELVMGGCLVL